MSAWITPSIERAAMALLVVDHGEMSDLYEPNMVDGRDVLAAAVDIEEIAQAMFRWDTAEHPAPAPTWESLTEDQRNVWRSGAEAIRTTLLGGGR